jgi:phosphoglycerol transferase MdoB-like AlkP superfamily enzyme
VPRPRIRALVAASPLREWTILVIVALFLFALTRLVLLVSQLLRAIPAAHAPALVMVQSFLVGIRFDLAVTGYAIALPMMLSLLLYVAAPGLLTSRVRQWCTGIAFLVVAFAVALNFLDLEFWPYFSQRLNAGINQWFDTPAMALSLVFEGFPVVQYTLLWLALSFVAWLILRRLLRRKDASPPSHAGFMVRLALALVATALLFLAIRGRIEPKSPLRTGNAFFSDNTFANQLALNSAFSLIQSLQQEQEMRWSVFHEVGIDTAFAETERLLRLPHTGGSPLTRMQTPLVVPPARPNLILILVESFTAEGIRAMGGITDPPLSPRIDSLIAQSVLFDNFYSNNIHTGHGLFDAVAGLPNPPGVALTKTRYGEQERQTWARILDSLGYRTFFFTTHDPHFDNMQGFMRAWGFHDIVSQDDYADRKASALGVFDHNMFDEAVRRFADLDRQGVPYAAVILTSTNHGPWVLPDSLPFAPVAPGPRARMFNTFRYTDWAIGEFMGHLDALPSRERTLVLITGDHGGVLLEAGKEIGIPYNYVHVPLIIHARQHPLIRSGKRLHTVGSQIDVGATMLDLAGISFENRTLGKSLFQKEPGEGFAPVVFHDDLGMFLGGEFFYLPAEGAPGAFRFEENPPVRVTGGTERYRRTLLSIYRSAGWLMDHPQP